MPTVSVVSAGPGDLDGVEALLRAADLPVQGVRELSESLWLARDGEALAGCVGLETYENAALLRSLCVAPACRGRGVGDLLVRTALRQAHGRRLHGVYLLTTTAADYFPRHGFRRIERDAVPASVRASAEFAALCPASAVAMGLEITAS